eukprot:TRINITY_DN276_c1_g1_i2.p1 TRINITY_DN276_c1_g1~~TRINITY_DN276_c1_g1_i2.p1  ORF type:complete len:448 (+),score=153.14 TRINITY_DN276_c1_g1_i2:48-1346(+)
MSKRQGGKVKPVKAATSKAAAEKKKQALSDKTFGMKNKKGKTAQKVAATYNAGGKSKEEKKKDQEREARKMAKEEKEKFEAEKAVLFKTVDPAKPKQKVQTVPPGVDPKSVLCINFKAGFCQAGEACIFSHDLNVERKTQKRDLYSDQRDLENDTMENWDTAKLQEVIAKKTAGKGGNPTAGVCNHFLKAIDEQKFGWFWECPSGEKCAYRHALPPGYELKRKTKDKVVEKSIEDILEEQRANLPSTGGTPVNAKSFFEWKEKILKQREAEEKKNKQARDAAIRSGKAKKTGREILQESGNYKDDTEEGEDLDVVQLLKLKKAEEERLDQENAEIVQKISAEVAEAERAFDKEVAALEAQGLSAAEAISKLNLRGKPQQEHNEEAEGEEEGEGEEGEGEEEGENVLEGVDTGLFTGDGEEELPEFSDENEET